MTKEKNHPLGQLLDKSAAGKTSASEENLLEDFMAEHYNKAAWDAAAMGNKDAAASNIYKGVLSHTANRKQALRTWLYAAAACVAIAIGVGFFMMQETPRETPMMALQTKTDIDSLRLADGTVVYLSANSVLQYPKHFEGKERRVTLLKGNAFFQVAKDAAHPFIITSGEIKTKVLGTSFHIRLKKDKCNVVVLTGKVNVSSATQNVNLVPGEEAVFKSGSLDKRPAHRRKLVNWYTEDIDLNNVTLNEVAKVIHYKYDVEIEPAGNEVMEKKLTVYIQKNASLTEVLQQINYITNLKFEQYGETIKIINTP